MAHELAELHYRTSTFYFDHHELYLMRKFLTVDRFGLQMRPVEFVRNIEVVLDASAACPCIFDALVLHGIESVSSPDDALRWCLEQLSRLVSTAARIKIIISLHMVGFRKIWLYQRTIELCELLRPFLERYNERGYTTDLKLCDNSGDEWKIDNLTMDEIRNITQQILDLEFRYT